MFNYALGFATCLGIAICAPSMFVAIKAKVSATVKDWVARARLNSEGE